MKRRIIIYTCWVVIVLAVLAGCSANAAPSDFARSTASPYTTTMAELPSAEKGETVLHAAGPDYFDFSYFASVVAPESPEPGKAAIVFTFDDGPLSDYLLAYPILKEYGIKGTSYIITKFTDQGLKYKLSWQQIKEMAGYGWVFGGHTYDHHNLTGMTDEEITKSCEQVGESFKAQGLEPPELMAYPYGSYNKRVINALKPFYKQARLAFYRTDFAYKDTDPYKIPSISADMRTRSQLNKDERLVDKACTKGAIIVFRVHTLYNKKPYDTVRINTHILSGCAPQTSSKLFGELVKYCVDKGCIFMTMPELLKLMDG